MRRASRCLQLDIGNSAAKWRMLVGDEIRARGRYLPQDESSIAALLDCDPAPEQIWVASVAAPAAEAALSERLRQRWQVSPWFARSMTLAGGLRNSYANPSRLGVDRWLAMLAGWERAQGAVCVVDAGSALTIDLVAADGEHEGGYIIPGMALMERALLLDTDRVRFAEDADYRLTPGRSTAEAVRHGIALAQAGALARVLDGFAPDARQAVDASAGADVSAAPARQQAVDEPQALDRPQAPAQPRAVDQPQALDRPRALYFCGGDGARLMQLADRGGEYLPDLVFEGLERQAALTG